MIKVGIAAGMRYAALILVVEFNLAGVGSVPATSFVFVLPDTGPNQAPVLP